MHLKIIIVPIITFFFLSTNIQSQIKKGIVIYKKQQVERVFVKKDKTINFNKFKMIEDKMIKALEDIEFQLSFKNNESTFEVVNSIDIEDNKFYRMALIPYGQSKFYNSAKERLEKTNAFGEDFLISSSTLNWELSNETKKIGDYTCFKAITRERKMYHGKEKEYIRTAWYSPEINASFGPIGYSGLPGLIVELKDGRNVYVATRIELNTTKPVTIKKPTKGKKVTDKEMNTMLSEAMGNFKKNKGY